VPFWTKIDKTKQSENQKGKIPLRELLQQYEKEAVYAGDSAQVKLLKIEHENKIEKLKRGFDVLMKNNVNFIKKQSEEMIKKTTGQVMKITQAEIVDLLA
jgi:hypothetical protein